MIDTVQEARVVSLWPGAIPLEPRLGFRIVVESKTAMLSLQAKACVKKLQAFDLRFLEEQLIWKDRYGDALAYECVTEYRKWIALHIAMRDPIFVAAHFSGRRVPLGMPSRYIDNTWHRHILFTKDYPMFCKTVAGRMIHHNPCTRRNVTRMSADATREAYRVLFGEMPKIWDTSEKFLANTNSAGCGCGCSSRD